MSNNRNENYSLSILEFFMFNRDGVCLVHLDLQDNDNLYTNKALDTANDKANDNRYKLIYGLLFSMKSFVKNISPNKTYDFFKSFITSSFKLHYQEFLNGVRFVILSNPVKVDLSHQLKDIYSAYYVNFISKNIMVDKDKPINNEMLMELITIYLNNLNSNK